MKKIFSAFAAVLCAASMFAANYGILVNGKTYFAASYVGPDPYGGGYEQYLAHAQVNSGDYCQLCDADNKAAWAVDLDNASVSGFTRNGDRYEVSVEGCYDFYIKLKYQADQLYIGNGSDCGEGIDISGQGGEQGGGDDPQPGTKYFMKNNWNGGNDWSWKEMTASENKTFKLEKVVFGGTGVNYNTAESDEGAEWVAADAFDGDKIGALDTVTFVLDLAAAKKVKAILLGKYNGEQGGDDDDDTPQGAAGHDFYVMGWINGADAGEAAYDKFDDQYKFVDGKIMLDCKMGSYIAVKDDQTNYYYAEGTSDAQGDKVTLKWANGWSPCQKWAILEGVRYIIIRKIAFKGEIELELVDKATFDAYHFDINDDGESAVENTTIHKNVIKTIINGQVVIIKDGVQYNLLGAQLQ